MLAVVAAVLARDSLSAGCGGCCDGDGDFGGDEYFLLLWLLFVVAVMMLLLTVPFCLLSLVMLALAYLSSSLLRARCSLGPNRP